LNNKKSIYNVTGLIRTFPWSQRCGGVWSRGRSCRISCIEVGNWDYL